MSILSTRGVRGTPSERTCSLPAARAVGDRPLAVLWRAERSGGLHGTKRSGVEEAWGYPSDAGRAQVGRSGRQAKRCPNTTGGKDGCERFSHCSITQI